MDRQQKVERIQALRNVVEQAKAIVLLRFKGLSVEESTSLRRELREEGAGITVVKNTLLRLALKDTNKSFLEGHLKGPVAMAYTRQDPVGMAKAVQAHLKQSQSLTLIAGSLDGKPLDPAQIEALATLPSMDGMRSMFVGLLSQVPRSFLGVLSAAQRDMVCVLKARGQKLSEQVG